MPLLCFPIASFCIAVNIRIHIFKSFSRLDVPFTAKTHAIGPNVSLTATFSFNDQISRFVHMNVPIDSNGCASCPGGNYLVHNSRAHNHTMSKPSAVQSLAPSGSTGREVLCEARAVAVKWNYKCDRNMRGTWKGVKGSLLPKGHRPAKPTPCGRTRERLMFANGMVNCLPNQSSASLKVLDVGV